MTIIFNSFKKSRQRKSKKTTESKDPAFYNDNNKKCFQKYNCTDIYLKTLDMQKWSELLQDFKAHGDQIKSDLDPQDNKLDSNRKSQIEAIQNKIKAKQSNKEILEVKRDIIAENITKQGKKLRASPVKRIPATSNFIYEFNPFANAEQLNSLSRTCLRPTSNSEQKLPCARTDITSFVNSNSNEENGNFLKRKSSAVLPELKSRIDFVKDHSDWNITDSTQNTCLPILGKANSAKTLSKQRLDNECEPSDIDHEVEKVKSAWQALRAERNWTKGKDCIGSVHTKKLYEILEKVTCEVDRIQERYMDPNANHYLRKSATNVLKTNSKPSLEEEAEIMRNIIFPKGKTKLESEIFNLKNFDTEMTNKQPTKNTFPSKHIAKNRSVHTNAYGHNIDNDIISESINALNSDKKQHTTTDIMELAFKDDGKTRMKIKSSIEKYLQNYSNNIYKPRDIEEKKGEEHFQDITSSAKDIANILASHNIKSHGLYENVENYDDAYDSEDCMSERDKNFPCSNIATNTTQVTFVDKIQDSKTICDNTFLENTEYKNTQPIKVDVKSIGTSKQSNLTSYQDNAFIKMGLNVLEKNLSEDKLSQILQSEYLKKNLSL
ncbi:uncharacterized protein LOC115237474 isoform X1 [Formica exsecta]|uniref:uncharacterized protein LOC115237474 isoform X1 n=2 Tax=Formica exsecta TaxID=72781 RepID=UPI00114290AF|nr:uncharacterized protein LOC115237474 isoform X1 [Formica exsecta]